MNLQELRIGNYVSMNFDKEGQEYIIPTIVKELSEVNCRVLSKGEVFVTHYDNIKPIPLTEDILLKCGAKLEGSEWQIEYDDTAFIFEGSLGRGFYYTGGEGCKLSVLFYNLHELQNLFRPITGEELNVEL